jgi:hypothetical protein
MRCSSESKRSIISCMGTSLDDLPPIIAHGIAAPRPA